MYKIKFLKARFVILAYLALVFQSTLIHLLGPVKIDFLLIMVVFYSLYNGSRSGMFCGMIIGLGEDVLSGGILGINCFTLGCLGFLAGLLEERVYTSHVLTRTLVGFAAASLSVLIYYVLAGQFYRLAPFSENIWMTVSFVFLTTAANVAAGDILERAVIEKQRSLL